VEVPAGIQHCKHTVFQSTEGAHCTWKAFVAKHPFAQHWRSCEIAQWLQSTGVDCIDPTTGKDTFQKMLVACKRYATSCKTFVNPNINKGYSGQLVDMCAKMSLSAQRHELGVDFTPDSPYLVPGFLALEDSTNEAGGLCLLFTTFHLALNYVRAAHWFQGQVTLAFDHTFKMDMKGRPHFTINVKVRHAATPPPLPLSLSASVWGTCSSEAGCVCLQCACCQCAERMLLSAVCMLSDAVCML
jgi:hypothetical protein